MQNLFNKYKTTFLAKQGKPRHFPKSFSLLFGRLSKSPIEPSEPWNIGSMLFNAKFNQRIQNHFFGKASQELKLSKNLLCICEFPIKLFWSVSKAWIESFKLSKNFFKSVEGLNRISWAMEYWFKALKCQLWLTNTKPFSWESKASIETLKNLFSHTEVTYKLALESGKNLSWVWSLTSLW